ncbi:4-hydroxy-2-oxoheptanedioate aldolase [Hamadaea flava]|uniref:HpcH/HpaI aldolase/citrate lyase family protein n=1 Tax=Hamadaea flava TaxID=1742688 RepID=A0ABV8LU17_9ACTN|nr:aldolase/citrate lyase family protein [Hamadaea flava]MCP2327666.1 4-hydroxy-2-oxoheptanedioate aldolase [Hamadaea flava]
MRDNIFQDRLRAGGPAYGVWLSLPSPAAARQLARVGADFLVVDAEHGPMGAETMTAMVAAIADAGGCAVVRIAENTTENVKRALDAGAAAVIGPMIDTPEEAAALVAAAKFPPIGRRSLGSAWAGLAFDTTLPGYFAEANTKTLVIAQIESATALSNVEAIAAVPGLDGLFVGPVDLAVSLGLTPAPENPELAGPLAAIRQAAARHRLPVGIYCSDSRAAIDRVQSGFQFVNVASDLAALLREVRWHVGQVRP